jgi:hypothetical protein
MVLPIRTSGPSMDTARHSYAAAFAAPHLIQCAAAPDAGRELKLQFDRVEVLIESGAG